MSVNRDERVVAVQNASYIWAFVPSDNGAATKLDAVIAGCGKAAERFQGVADQCAALSPRLSSQGRPFSDQSLRMQATFMAAASRCLVDAAQGLKGIQKREAYRQWMRKAKADAAAMEAVLATPTSGSLSNWYAEERIFGLKEMQAMIDRRVKGMMPTSKTKKP
jgi:hypothetical protein